MATPSRCRLLALLICLVITCPGPARSMCGSEGLSAWPEPDVRVPPNVQFVLRGYGYDQARVHDLGRLLKPQLVEEPGGAVLKLTPGAVYRGVFSVSRVVLVPERPLAPGKRYTLKVTRGSVRPGLPGSGEALAPGEGPPETVSTWTCGGAADRAAPLWTAPSTAAGGNYLMFGCGPSVHAYIAVAPADKEGPVLVEAEVYKVEAGVPPVPPTSCVGFWYRQHGLAAPAASTQLLEVNDGKLGIGHGMCAGEYRLERGVSYDVHLTAVDAAGNRAAQGAVVRIVGPEPKKMR